MRLIDANAIRFESNEFDTYNDYLTAFDAIDKATTVAQWHYPSKGELPKEDMRCIVTLESIYGDKERFIYLAKYSQKHGWRGFEQYFYKVVAWMPSPELPKEIE